MSLALRISEPATLELQEAVGWYEAQRAGLGAELFDAVNEAFTFLQRRPRAGNPISPDAQTRRFLLQRFPYQVVYRIRPGEIVIVAVAHLKRRPGYWRHRTS